MTVLSVASLARLAGAHPQLQKLFNACAADPKCPSFQILDGQRGRVAQEKAFSLGNSRAHFGQSAHNWAPAVALDVVPNPLNWNDLKAFTALGTFVMAKAKVLGLEITWGATWKTIKDYPHYELTNWHDLVAAKKVKAFTG